jgi:hypothetical protein
MLNYIAAFISAALLLMPTASSAVEIDGFMLGATKGATLSRLAEVDSPEGLVGCRYDRRDRVEYCNAYGVSERFAVLGLPIEDAFIEFQHGKTRSIEFHLRIRGDRESVYAAALKAVSEKLSLPSKFRAIGAEWKGEGWVVMLNKNQGGGVALLLMTMNTEPSVALLRDTSGEDQV